MEEGREERGRKGRRERREKRICSIYLPVATVRLFTHMPSVL